MELIYQIFRIFAIGGNLCQPDTTIERYLAITKAVYKELVTVFKYVSPSTNPYTCALLLTNYYYCRDSTTLAVKVSGKAYSIRAVPGLTLFPANPESSWNAFILIVDPLKKTISILKNTYKKFW
jgi:hypothetical protein